MTMTTLARLSTLDECGIGDQRPLDYYHLQMAINRNGEVEKKAARWIWIYDDSVATFTIQFAYGTNKCTKVIN